jgi:hypothetical protein
MATVRFQWVRGALVLAPLAAAGCTFDFDKLYANDAGLSDASSDASRDADASAETPDELITLFRESFALSDECVACAQSECAEANTRCRDDADCSALTRCIATRDTPAQRESCRASAWDWLAEPDTLFDRDVNGPFGNCVFLQRCAEACKSREDVSCVDKYEWDPTTGKVTYRLRLSDTVYEPVAGAQLRVCQETDAASCTGPTASRVYTSDANGIVDVPLPISVAGGFVGYLQITGAMLQPQLVRFGWPVSRGAVMNLPVISSQLLLGLTALSDEPVDPTRGMLQVRMTGCSGSPLAGAVVSVTGQDKDPNILTWYTSGSGKDIAPDFDVDQTDALGAAGVINIPEGRTQVTVKESASGRVITQMWVPIRKNHITTVLGVPTTSN